MRLILTLLMIYLCLIASLKADFVPIHAKTKMETMAYLRIPLPWKMENGLSDAQKSRLTNGLILPILAKGSEGYFQRQLLSKLNSPIEILVTPPKQPVIPIPSVLLRAKYIGEKEKMSEILQAFIKEMWGRNMAGGSSWIKFKRSQEGSAIVDSTNLMGIVKIKISDDQFSLYYTYNDKEFDQKFNVNDVSHFEKTLKVTQNDFLFKINMDSVMANYFDYLKGLLPQVHQIVENWGFSSLQGLSIYTEGASEDFKVKVNGELKKEETVRNFFSDIKNPIQKINVPYVSDSEFWGAFYIPKVSAASLNQKLKLMNSDLSRNFAHWNRLMKSLGSSLSFSWVDGTPAPVIVLALDDVKTFESSLAELLKSEAVLAKEKAKPFDFTHIRWKSNTFSYRVFEKNKQNFLVFSPLAQAIRDVRIDDLIFREQSKFLNLSAKSAGKTKAAYYSLLHLLLNYHMGMKRVVDPNSWPAFSQTSLQEKSWNSKTELKIDLGKEKFEIILQQPYGLPGFLGGTQSSSANYLSFISLLILTGGTL